MEFCSMQSYSTGANLISHIVAMWAPVFAFDLRGGKRFRGVREQV